MARQKKDGNRKHVTLGRLLWNALRLTRKKTNANRKRVTLFGRLICKGLRLARRRTNANRKRVAFRSPDLQPAEIDLAGDRRQSQKCHFWAAGSGHAEIGPAANRRQPQTCHFWPSGF